MPKRTIVITGARGGVGEQRHAGWLLPVTGLSSWGDPASKTNAIADELDADYVCADFSNLGQVHALADELRQRYRRIDLLANNAGSVFAADGITAEGYNPTIIGTSSSSQRLMRPTPRCAFHRVLAGPPSGGGAADYGWGAGANPDGVVAVTLGVATLVSGEAGGVVVVIVCPLACGTTTGLATWLAGSVAPA